MSLQEEEYQPCTCCSHRRGGVGLIIAGWIWALLRVTVFVLGKQKQKVILWWCCGHRSISWEYSLGVLSVQHPAYGVLGCTLGLSLSSLPLLFCVAEDKGFPCKERLFIFLCEVRQKVWVQVLGLELCVFIHAKGIVTHGLSAFWVVYLSCSL